MVERKDLLKVLHSNEYKYARLFKARLFGYVKNMLIYLCWDRQYQAYNHHISEWIGPDVFAGYPTFNAGNREWA